MEQPSNFSSTREWSFTDYISLAIRRKWIIISVFILTFTVAVLYHFSQPPVYKSGSTFIIESNNKGGFSTSKLILEESTRPFGFYKTLVESKIYRNRLLTAIQNDSVLNSSSLVTGEMFSELYKKLILKETEHQEMYSLGIMAHDPVVAYRFAVLAVDEFKERCQEIELEESRNVVDFVNKQIEEARKNLEHAERELQEFTERTKLNNIDQVNGGIIKRLMEIETQLDEVETERKLAQANYDSYKARLRQLKHTDTPSIYDNESPNVQSLRKEIEQLENSKGRLAERVSLSSPQISAIDAKLEAKKDELRKAIFSSMRPGQTIDLNNTQDESKKEIFNERIVTEELNLFMLSNKEKFLRSLIEKYRKQHPNMLEHTIELAQLQRTKSVNENLYTFLIEKSEEAKITAATGTGGIRIVDAPSLPESPVSRKTPRTLAVFFILAFGLGFGLAFVRDYLDNSIYTVEDLKRLGDIPSLGTIPLISKKDSKTVTLSNNSKRRSNVVSGNNGFEDRMNGYKNKVISSIQSKEPVVDSYRHIRTNIQFADVDEPINKILITSSIPGEGKTLTAANLAISFAELGKRICVVDCDLRKSHQHVLFNVRKSPGLSDYLARDLQIEKVVYITRVPNLYVIPSGTIPPNPAEMLASQKMADLIRKLEQNFDFVIYDSPPIISVTDPVLLSKQVGQVIMVIRFGKTNWHLVDDSLRRMRNVNSKIAGTILNGMQKAKGYGYYRYDYSYYQKSYYGSEQGKKKKKFSIVN